jgi:hypothetical protein
MKKIAHFCPIETGELMKINGGGFAYDLGRSLRFLWKYQGNPYRYPEAIVDWIINDTINKLENGYSI